MCVSGILNVSQGPGQATGTQSVLNQRHQPNPVVQVQPVITPAAFILKVQAVHKPSCEHKLRGVFVQSGGGGGDVSPFLI